MASPAGCGTAGLQLSMQEGETGESGIRDHPWLHSNSEASPSYRRPCFKKGKTKATFSHSEQYNPPVMAGLLSLSSLPLSGYFFQQKTLCMSSRCYNSEVPPEVLPSCPQHLERASLLSILGKAQYPFPRQQWNLSWKVQTVCTQCFDERLFY